MKDEKNEAMEGTTSPCEDTLPCAVARDLIPLEIDGVASGESAALLRRHMERCGDCRAAYARMSDGEREKHIDAQALPMRDLMRALWHRLRLRSALTALAVALVVMLGLSVLYARLDVTQWLIPCEAVDPQSVRVTLNEEEATLAYTVHAPVYNQLGGRFWLEEDETRENAYTLHVQSSVSWTSRLRGLLTGTPKVEIRRSLYDFGQGYGLTRGDVDEFPPDAVLTAVYYDEAGGVGMDGASILLWEASPEQYPLLTLRALDEAYCEIQGGWGRVHTNWERVQTDWKTLDAAK